MPGAPLSTALSRMSISVKSIPMALSPYPASSSTPSVGPAAISYHRAGSNGSPRRAKNARAVASPPSPPAAAVSMSRTCAGATHMACDQQSAQLENVTTFAVAGHRCRRKGGASHAATGRIGAHAPPPPPPCPRAAARAVMRAVARIIPAYQCSERQPQL
jgi:hypothetical protein